MKAFSLAVMMLWVLSTAADSSATRPATQPEDGSATATQVISEAEILKQARGDLDWSVPKLEYTYVKAPYRGKWSGLVGMRIENPVDMRLDELYGTEAGKHLSKAQRDMLAARARVDGLGWAHLGQPFGPPPPLPPGQMKHENAAEWEAWQSVNVALPLATEEDARWMVQAYVQAASAKRLEVRVAICRELAQLRKEAAEVEAKLAGVEARAKDAAAQERGIWNAYGLPWGDVEQVKRDLVELQHAMRLAEIEVAGMRAKLDAIMKAREQAGTGTDLPNVLDRMRFEQDIELAGAMARIETMKNQQELGRLVLNVSRSAEQAQEESEKLRLVKTGSGDRIRMLEDKLSGSPETSPLRFLSDTVLIGMSAVGG